MKKYMLMGVEKMNGNGGRNVPINDG